MQFSDIREAVAKTIQDGIPGLRCAPRMVQIHPPTAVIELDHIDYHDSMELSSAVWFVNVTVLVSMNDVEAAQKSLDAYLSPDGDASVRAALEADETLGGVVSDVTVRLADGYQPYEVSGEATYLGVRFQVEVR
jgi:hypothetical protein